VLETLLQPPLLPTPVRMVLGVQPAVSRNRSARNPAATIGVTAVVEFLEALVERPLRRLLASPTLSAAAVAVPKAVFAMGLAR